MRKPLNEDQKAAKRERERLWRANNPEKVKAKNERFVQAHPEVFKDYYQANRDRRLAESLAYDQSNPERVKARARASYRSKKARGLPVRSADKDAARLRHTNRRALMRTSGERLARGFLTALLAKQRGRCGGCAASIRLKYHADHVTPLAKGGRHAPENIQLLCPACNMSKHAKDPIAWRQSLGQLL